MARYTEEEIKIPIVVARLYPIPVYNGIAVTYAELLETWADPRGTPTWEEIEDEWDVYLAEQATEESEATNLKDELLTLVATTSFADLETKINNIFADHTAGQRAFLLNAFRVLLHLAKQFKDL